MWLHHYGAIHTWAWSQIKEGGTKKAKKRGVLEASLKRGENFLPKTVEKGGGKKWGNFANFLWYAENVEVEGVFPREQPQEWEWEAILGLFRKFSNILLKKCLKSYFLGNFSIFKGGRQFFPIFLRGLAFSLPKEVNMVPFGSKNGPNYFECWQQAGSTMK